MPQYISDNTDDEISHAAFLSAYLKSKGEVPVGLTPFANLLGSQATGANKGVGRITNLPSLNVDTSWYFRYRSTGESALAPLHQKFHLVLITLHNALRAD